MSTAATKRKRSEPVSGMAHFVLHPGEQLALEAECNRLAKLHQDGPSFFIGQTSNMEGHGHALIEVCAGETTVTHWGTAAEYATILKNAHA